MAKPLFPNKPLSEYTAIEFQRMFGGFNIPDKLITAENSKLIPLYVLIEKLCLRTGFCFAGDKYLADSLNVSPTTVLRQRNRLAELSMIQIDGENKTRSIYVWWTWASKIKNDANRIEAFLCKVFGAEFKKMMREQHEKGDPNPGATFIDGVLDTETLKRLEAARQKGQKDEAARKKRYKAKKEKEKFDEPDFSTPGFEIPDTYIPEINQPEPEPKRQPLSEAEVGRGRPNTTVPSDAIIEHKIKQKYPAMSFFQLSLADRNKLLAPGGFTLEGIFDLVFLFEQPLTPLAYKRFKRLGTKDLMDIQNHVVRYAQSNFENPDYMKNLNNYLDIQNPGWRHRIRQNKTTQKKGTTGQTLEQTMQRMFDQEQRVAAKRNFFK